jgi:hypothetical protein
VGIWGLVALPAFAKAADPDVTGTQPGTTGASQMVLQALRSEAEGDLVARDRLLNQAAESDSQCAAAQWHRGRLQSEQGDWQSVEDCLADKSTSADLSAYEARRAASPEHALGQFELATWCLKNGFAQQARAHLRRTLEMAPDHTGARQLLGFRNMGGEWISSEQQAQLAKRAEDVRSALVKYGKQLTELGRKFGSRHAEVRAAARNELMELKDPEAIAPIEAILGSANVEAAQAALAWLSGIADPEATVSLARFAMFHPLPQVQRAAIAQIKTRPYHDYVPAVLEMLSSPVVSMAVPVVGPDGTLTGFRQSFAQERKGQTDIFVLDTRLSYSALPNPSTGRRRGLGVAPTDMFSQLEALERSVERASENSAAMQASNERIVARNRLIVRFLSEATEREFAQPADAWKWWDETNETEYQSLKPSNIRYGTSSLTSRNYNEFATRTALSLSGARSFVGECFARGTPIVTRKGLQPIETVRVGDLVLSRELASGELSWKPVVRTTTRPPRPVFEVSLDNETFCCTGGHLFWVSGQGWTKASALRPGDILHAAAQPVVVMKTLEKPEQQTFNLAVEQTQNYFVGKQMVLSHDVTDRLPTYLKVPGLIAVSR